MVGAGAAGLSVAAVTAQLGLRVVLIERARMGGDCLNTGCVPSKALLAAAHAAMDAGDAGRLGVRAHSEATDWDAVQRHVHGVIEAIAPADSRARFEGLGATVVAGEARFHAPDALAVDGRTLSARRIVLAAGSRPAVPDIPGLRDVPHVTHETLFELPERPEHLLILGGGAIGLEMAQAHAGLGCAVTVVERHRLGGREDPELVAVLRSALVRQGVTVLEGAVVERAEPGPALLLADGRRVAGTHLLVAAGRVPRTDTLDLDRGGVRASALGVATDRGLRSVSNRRVFAVGDIADPEGIGPRYLTHAASHHAGVVVRRAVFRLPARGRRPGDAARGLHRPGTGPGRPHGGRRAGGRRADRRAALAARRERPRSDGATHRGIGEAGGLGRAGAGRRHRRAAMPARWSASGRSPSPGACHCLRWPTWSCRTRPVPRRASGRRRRHSRRGCSPRERAGWRPG